MGKHSKPNPDLCPQCQYEKPPYTGLGTPVEVLPNGSYHSGDCPIFKLPVDVQKRLDEDLYEMAMARRRAMFHARDYFIG